MARSARLQHFWERVHASYWFVPALMTVSSAVLAVVALTLDRHFSETRADSTYWLYQGTAEGARWLLSTVAGSMVTVAGVSFSITILVLSLASSQFGPRLLRNFLRDTGNEVVLGTFISTFLYCILVLQGVRGVESDTFVPHISITIAIALAVVSLGVLIYFIHHVAEMIQVENVIVAAGREAEATIVELFPRDVGTGGPAQAVPPEPSWEVAARVTGYVEGLDGQRLIEAATDHDVVLSLVARPGRFVAPGDPLLTVHGGRPGDRSLRRKLQACFFVGRARTPLHDIGAAVSQLVEIGVRALSSTTNDPFTAIVCVDYLSAVLSRLAAAPEVSAYRYDAAGRLRLIATPVAVVDVIGGALDSVRRYARSYPEVMLRLLGAIEAVGRAATSDALRGRLLRVAETLRTEAESIVGEQDRARVQDRATDVLATISGRRSSVAGQAGREDDAS